MMNMKELRKNEIYTVTIEAYTSDGLGVCHIENRAVFVPKVLVGESCVIKILKVTATAVYGKLEELISASPNRLVPPCPYYGHCGGCSCMHMSYEEELRFKLNKVNNALSRIGKQELKATEIIENEGMKK